MKRQAWLVACMAGIFAFGAPSANAAVDVASYVRKDAFEQIKISPNGDYFAASVPLADRTVLVVLRRSDSKLIGPFRMGRNTHISYFHWATPERLLIGTSEKFGALEAPVFTGELFAIDADGGRPEQLVGARVDDGGLGTTIKPKKGNDRVWALPVHTPVVEGRHALVSVQPYGSDPYSTAQQLDLYSGRLVRVATAPVRAADFHTDNQGEVRFVSGSDSDNVRKLFYRTGKGAEWELVSIETDGRFEYPVGFSADDRIAYLRADQEQGPDAIVAFDLATRERKIVLRDDDSDPIGVEYRNGTRTPVGFYFMDGRQRIAFLDEGSQEARLQRSLEAAFEGQAVEVTSKTADGRLALIRAFNDRNPGDFYLFDTVAKKASHVIARRDWFDPEQQAPMEPIRLAARDGLSLHGYLTTPRGTNGKGLPLVVMPHGGPFGIRDAWGFDSQVQMLARAGYAVLQVNYRGSAGYGRDFEQAGAREWGLKMQDDITDATRWAIAQGIADKDRVCIYGASYGAYAALMGVAKEQALYRCAAGYVGVYDLPKMQADDSRRSSRLGNWSADWVGKKDQLGAVSPNRMADRIKVPVFLAAGGEDEVAPIEHSKMMEQALRKAGVPVETLYYDTEGHGFYDEQHLQEYYTRLLAFLSKHLGGGLAAVPAPGASAAK